jgi:predicted nucleic acid-binding protein
VALVVLDACVIIAFREPGDALHARAVEAFRAHTSDELVLPASVLAEILVGPLRHGAASVSSLEAFMRDFAMRIVAIDSEIARAAAVLRAQNPSLRLPDAFVLATADKLEANAVLTGDATWLNMSSRAEII